jgi:hypothetical protein
MRVKRVSTLVLCIAAGLVTLPGCGSDGGSDAGSSGTAADAQEPSDSSQENPQTTQAKQGGGVAVLKVGEDEYKFDTVRCAFGTDQTRNEDWDFSLSAIQDGLQLSVSRGAEGGKYGDSVDLDDIQNFENPSVKWGSSLRITPGQAPPAQLDIVEIDGKEVTATGDFVDGTKETVATREYVSGTLTATCP